MHEVFLLSKRAYSRTKITNEIFNPMKINRPCLRQTYVRRIHSITITHYRIWLNYGVFDRLKYSRMQMRTLVQYKTLLWLHAIYTEVAQLPGSWGKVLLRKSCFEGSSSRTKKRKESEFKSWSIVGSSSFSVFSSSLDEYSTNCVFILHWSRKEHTQVRCI